MSRITMLHPNGKTSIILGSYPPEIMEYVIAEHLYYGWLLEDVR